MSVHTTTIDQETVDRLSVELHRCSSDFEAPPGPFAADTFFDFLPPMWRFQFEGAVAEAPMVAGKS